MSQIFVRMLRGERMKLRHSPMWIAFFILPLLPAFFGTFNYVYNSAILTEAWYALWTQHTLFSCYFFLPALIGVYCSYLWRLEHLNHNWNAVMTSPVPVPMVYLAKLASAAGITLLAQLWIGFLFVASGLLCGLQFPLPEELASWIGFGMIGSIVVCAAQLFLSLVFRSFAIPVGIAMIGGIIGLAALAKGYAFFFPYSLLSLGMRANNPSMELEPVKFLGFSALFILFFSILSILWMTKRDVRAE